MIAAPRSRQRQDHADAGAAARAASRRRRPSASAKCGPDYIDPPFHSAASGRPSVNLDSWAMPPALLHALAAQAGRGCDLIICEALMGLFDGVPASPGRTGSSADVAAALGWPVLLVLDASGQSQSAAAIVKGCATYDPRITIAGVVLNRVGSPRHARLATEAIEALGIPVVGALPRSDAIALPERHLGLIQAGETDGSRRSAGSHRRLHRRTRRCRGDPCPGRVPPRVAPDQLSRRPPARPTHRRRAGRRVFLPLPAPAATPGARPVPRSASSPRLPTSRRPATATPAGSLAATPNCMPAALSQAHGFMTGLRNFAETRPIHGECGGYMVLGTSLTDAGGTTHAMAGLLECRHQLRPPQTASGLSNRPPDRADPVSVRLAPFCAAMNSTTPASKTPAPTPPSPWSPMPTVATLRLPAAAVVLSPAVSSIVIAAERMTAGCSTTRSRARLTELIAWRRDVRRFSDQPGPGAADRDPAGHGATVAFGRQQPALALGAGRHTGQTR